MTSDTIQPSVGPQSRHPAWCKICGIKSEAQADAVAEAGGDAIGLNFIPVSPRFVEPPLAARIAAAVTCTRVALFLNPSVQQVQQVLDTVPVDLLQFHGAETPDFCAQFGVPYIKALGVETTDSNISAATTGVTTSATSGQAAHPPVESALQSRIGRFPQAWALLLDACLPGLAGGTGHVFDWSEWPAPDVVQGRKLILAGGLNVANVAQGIRQLEPWGVDVSGGVEGPVRGDKDIGLIREFIAEVKRVG